MAGRKLVSTRRRIDALAGDRYEEAWAKLAEAVRAVDAHAWRFRSEHDAALFVEFLEFGADLDPRRDPDVSRALEGLEMVASGASEAWIDAEDSSQGKTS